MSYQYEATKLFHKMLGENFNNGCEQGAYEERERIIELIKNSIRECECANVGMTYCRHNSTQIDLLALIKGENK